WNKSAHPVVGISWYEAIAFCRWLSAITSESIMLPTTQQWQRAAQGDDERSFPWGWDWDGSQCNNSVYQIISPKTIFNKGTTRVNQYEGRGDSPFGVLDMSGNVWEWCRTKFWTGRNELKGAEPRTVRGGSWINDLQTSFRVDTELWYFPNQEGNW